MTDSVNPHDNMTNVELALNTLAEVATTEIYHQNVLPMISNL